MTESVTNEPEHVRDDSAPTAPADQAAPATPTTSAAPTETAEPPPARRRPSPRVLRTVGRWTAVVAAFGVFCAGTAYGITRMERHEVPGLATEDDGRWEYPKLTLPALPSGSPRPFAPGNTPEIHHADLRDLLLPTPEGAKEDEELPSPKGGWVTIEDYTGLYGKEDGEELRQRLVDDAVRHIAARGWTMPDGTRTSVHLLRFNSGAAANYFHAEALAGGTTPGMDLAEAPKSVLDEEWPIHARPENVLVYSYDEEKPRGKTHTRHAYLVAGDTLALVVQSREGTAPAVPYWQTVILQAQLLG